MLLSTIINVTAPFLLHFAGVHDEADVVNGDGRLRYVGGNHDLSDVTRRLSVNEEQGVYIV